MRNPHRAGEGWVEWSEDGRLILVQMFIHPEALGSQTVFHGAFTRPKETRNYGHMSNLGVLLPMEL